MTRVDEQVVIWSQHVRRIIMFAAVKVLMNPKEVKVVNTEQLYVLAFDRKNVLKEVQKYDPMTFEDFEKKTSYALRETSEGKNPVLLVWILKLSGTVPITFIII